MKKVGIAALSAGILFSGVHISFDQQEAEAKKPEWAGQNNGKAQNVIYMIPDGYSAAYATNYRWFKGEDASFDAHVKGLMKTHSADTEVTDSAAAGTAMATGVKTNNGMVGVDPDGVEVDSILDAAEDADKATGLVATSTITHATPAVFGASVASRSDEALIAPQYFENGVDVLLGGGRDLFLPESEGGKQPEANLIEEAQADGYEYVTNFEELSASTSDKVLGLFADEAMKPELERYQTEEPSIAEMTVAAINALSQDKDGFFLMVEGSQIDWAGHAHDAAWAMHDTMAFDEAVEAALSYAERDGKTLVVVAGDHETGGMSVGSNGEYALNAEILRDVTATGSFMVEQLDEERTNIAEVVRAHTGLELTTEEVDTIWQADDTATAINETISDRALIGWTSSAHTGTDLPIYAYGPQSQNFVGMHDNTDIPRIIAEAMKLELNN